MIYDPNKHHRRSIRLQGYDYAQNGAYFITICIQSCACLLGYITSGTMELSDGGKMVVSQWNALPQRFPQVQLDEYIVMPNHFHGIITISPVVGAPLVGALSGGAESAPNAHEQTCASPNTKAPTRGAPTGMVQPHIQATATPTIGDIVGAFKSLTTREYVKGVQQHHWPAFEKRLWQRNYHEHIIRQKKSLCAIREYIMNNPVNWPHDEMFYEL